MTTTSTYERMSSRSLRASNGEIARSRTGMDSVRTALSQIGAGRAVVVVDTSGSDHLGYLVMAARAVTAAQVAFLVRYTSGVLCVPLPATTCDRLHLPQMVRHNDNVGAAEFTVSVDATDDVTTGISASDRATTIRLLADPKAEPDDFSRPGHVFPIRACNGGVLSRPRHTEAAVDLARLSGAGSAAVIGAVVSDDDTDITATDLAAFAMRHQLPIITINDLVAFRLATEQA